MHQRRENQGLYSRELRRFEEKEFTLFAYRTGMLGYNIIYTFDNNSYYYTVRYMKRLTSLWLVSLEAFNMYYVCVRPRHPYIESLPTL